ncbi:hypothetical protein CC117_00715 [Parafrankia colletiae]|uniref:Uncharacterized protein n=1 Tax=Parafrankia colletiae TaxID=573497 RepID=A0A1S1RKA3_9ACTN|nr:hypothetical protein [Parafrankia colletiae]MCK9904283.1 hypothetical protein [Frankia sp. Cpl3]OHV46211.1 hypothetical protein CC117_00715 [Parafrankia colletiae]
MALTRTPPLVDPATLRPGDIIAAPHTRRTLIIVGRIEPPTSPDTTAAGSDDAEAEADSPPPWVIHGSHLGTGAPAEIPLDDGEQVALHRPAGLHQH